MTTMTTTSQKLRVAIVGGGISGLSAAWYLEKQAAANDLDLEYTLLEKAPRWGGKILTEAVDDFVIEAGPDSFLTQKPWALQLARELEMDEQLLGTNDDLRHVFVLIKGRPVILPEGVLLIVPTKFMPFALSPLISPLGKLRMGLDLFIPAKKDDEDETLADFIKRRLGHEALDRIAEPLMSGIYNAEADKQSIMATFPRFRDIEKKHGSLIRGMLAARRQRAAAQKETSPTSGPKLSVFMSFQDGVQALVENLVPKLTGDLRTEATVSTIETNLDGSYTLHLEGGSALDVEAVVLTTPSFITADLVRDIAPDAAAKLEGIRYVSTGTISLAFRQADIPKPLAGFGLVIPSSENRPINAITISSTKFNHRAPEGHVLMRAFYGGSRSPQSMNLDDNALLEMVRDQLKQIMGIEAEPMFHRIYRWWNANPQYDIGHLERVAAIEGTLPHGLYVTGSPYRGVGIPDCVHQSQQMAEKLVSKFTEKVIS